MSSDSTTPISYAYKYWISFEVRNTYTDRSRRFNTTIFLTRKPKDESDIYSIEQLLKAQVLKNKIKGFELKEENISLTLMSWPHQVGKVDMNKIPQKVSTFVDTPDPIIEKKPSRPVFQVIIGGKETK